MSFFRRLSNLKSIILTVLGLFLLCVFLFPIYWMYISSFKSNVEISKWPPTFWPDIFELNIIRVLDQVNVLSYMENSAVIALGSAFITLVFGLGSAWVLARYRSIWLDIFLFLIILMQNLPAALMTTPLFILFNIMGILDTRLSVMLAVGAKSIPFFIIILRPTFLSIPKELEEAALVDGCKGFNLFRHIIFPLVRNGVYIAFSLVFMTSYGEYVFSRTFLQSSELFPASVGITTEFFGQYGRDITSALSFAIIYITPILAIFVILQRQLTDGLTSGAVK